MVFDDSGSYIENKTTGRRTVVTERSGTYAFDLWVPASVRKVQEVQKPQEEQVINGWKIPVKKAPVKDPKLQVTKPQVTKGMFAALAENESDSGEESDFVRQDNGLM